jgi:hypothetical protein
MFGKPPKTRELGQCTLWKNIAPIAKNAENRAFSQMLKKNFWRRGKKIFLSNAIAGQVANLLYAKTIFNREELK